MSPESKPRLLILGDSLSLGATEVQGSEIMGYVAKNYVDWIREALPELEVVLEGDINRTTIEALEKIDASLAACRPQLTLLTLGGNDADLQWRRFVITQGKVIQQRVAVKTYRENLRKLVGKIRLQGSEPILTDMTSHYLKIRGPYISALCQRDVTSWLEARGGQEESDRLLSEYRHTVGEVAQEMQVTLIPYGQRLSRYEPESMLGIDGTHLSAAGHEMMARELIPGIRELFLRLRTGEKPA